MIASIAHINLTVPPGTIETAAAFYGATLGLTRRPVPADQEGKLAWFDIGASGQQIHIAPHRGADGTELAAASFRHPCFRVDGRDALDALQRCIWAHFEAKTDGAPRACDQPGRENSGEKGAEYPDRFFVRDFAGNRLEFSV